MKVRALKSFEGIKDLERDVFPKEGDIWEVTEERAKVLKEHNVVEFIEEEPAGAIYYDVPENTELKVEMRLEKKPKKKKSSKK